MAVKEDIIWSLKNSPPCRPLYNRPSAPHPQPHPRANALPLYSKHQACVQASFILLDVMVMRCKGMYVGGRTLVKGLQWSHPFLWDPGTHTLAGIELWKCDTLHHLLQDYIWSTGANCPKMSTVENSHDTSLTAWVIVDVSNNGEKESCRACSRLGVKDGFKGKPPKHSNWWGSSVSSQCERGN